MVTSTMMTTPLTLTQILQHGRKVHADREIITWQGDSARKVTFADTYERMTRLANALEGLGVGQGDVVGTFMWNNQEHFEAYFAVPCMGAVLHMLNIRLFPEQLDYVIQDGGDKVILVDDSLIPVLAKVKDKLGDVEHIVVIGDGDASALERDVLRYDDLIADASPGYDWPELDENTAASMCYTSGTTGNPKGVVYSHRSQWTHTFGALAGGLDVKDGSKTLLIVPQFHANAWGLVYICWAIGSDVLQPAQFLQPEPLSKFIAAEKPTYAAAVPSVWNGILAYGQDHELDFSSLGEVVVGGAAVPRSMVEDFKSRYDVEIVQGWGMTEMSPLGTVGMPPARITDWDEGVDYRVKAGRIVPGVEMRLIGDDGEEQPWDGKTQGEVQVRGAWITGSYHGIEAPEKFDNGWLRTGDIGVIDGEGYLSIVDRAKDVIKSGGEWISSVDLENAIQGHPDVAEAAVIGVPDERWDERPLACVVLKEGATLTPKDLSDYLNDEVAKWWIPERWTFIDEVPKTSVGKYSKKDLREKFDAGELTVERADD